MLFCEECGSKIRETESQCGVCGEPVSAPAKDGDANNVDEDNVTQPANDDLAAYEKRLDGFLDNIIENAETQQFSIPSKEDMLPVDRAGAWDALVEVHATVVCRQDIVEAEQQWDADRYVYRGQVIQFCVQHLQNFLDQHVLPLFSRERQILEVFREDALHLAKRQDEKQEKEARMEEVEELLKAKSKVYDELRTLKSDLRQQYSKARDATRELEDTVGQAKDRLEEANEELEALESGSGAAAAAATAHVASTSGAFVSPSTATDPMQYLQETMAAEMEYYQARMMANPAKIAEYSAMMQAVGPKYQALFPLAAMGQYQIPSKSTTASAPSVPNTSSPGSAEDEGQKSIALEKIAAAKKRLADAQAAHATAKAEEDNVKKDADETASQADLIGKEKAALDKEKSSLRNELQNWGNTDEADDLRIMIDRAQSALKNQQDMAISDIRRLYNKLSANIIEEFADAADDAAREKRKAEQRASMEKRMQEWRDRVNALANEQVVMASSAPAQFRDQALEHGLVIAKACAIVENTSDMSASPVSFIKISFTNVGSCMPRSTLTESQKEATFYQQVLPLLAQKFTEYFRSNTGRFQEMLRASMADDILHISLKQWEESPQFLLDDSTFYFCAPDATFSRPAEAIASLADSLDVKTAVEETFNRCCKRCTHRVFALRSWIKGYCRSCWRVMHPPKKTQKKEEKKVKIRRPRRCFASDTIVARLDDGAKTYSSVPMSQVKVGDILLTAAENSNIVKSPVVYVRHTLEHPGTDKGTILSVDGEHLAMTYDHLVWNVTLQRFVMARDVLLGDHLLIVERDGTRRTAPVTRIQAKVTIRELTTLYTQHGTVLANSVWASCYESSHQFRHYTALDTRMFYQVAPGAISKPLIAKLWDIRDQVEDFFVDSYFEN